ncbi:hypothetical protein DC31_12830 [Microbacterium sp. CH12i]|uniref:hypothetical protein n=1 Tax=Microbacterium sp. CH12i TaxID=1479651 RepID=UPI0004616534|nr:hypothetical protein [Microbacterium sp. CH12i]KDA06181.1 hypothetical protein DC31_12830 [Microbacterium sp. CH12i]
MNQVPGGPVPVSQFPVATSRSLDSWLSDQNVNADPREISTRLQWVAFARAADISVGAAMLSLGITAIAIGFFWGAAAGSIVPMIVFGIVAVLLVLLGLLLIHRARSRWPNERRSRVIRGAGTARGGWFAAGGIWLVFAVILLSTLPSLASREEGIVIGLVGIVVCMAFLLVSGLAIPATVLARARQSLRRVASTDLKYRTMLEQDRLTWHPQFGDQMYGPL